MDLVAGFLPTFWSRKKTGMNVNKNLTLYPTKMAIPPELTDQIIDHLHVNKSALRACGLVCRGWVSSSRFHLFSSVSLNPLVAPAFLDLTDTPHGTVIPHVRYLCITESQGQSSWSDQLLTRIKVFERVTSLMVYNTDLTTSHRSQFLTYFSRLEALSLFGCRFDCLDQFTASVGAHSTLRKLSLYHVSYGNGGGQPTEPRTCPLSLLEKLAINTNSVDVFQWLHNLNCSSGYPHLADVDLTLKAAELHSATTLLATLGPVLERLKLRINVIDICNYQRVCDNLDLKPLKSLRRIHFDVDLLVPRSGLYVKWIKFALKSLHSTHLEEIAFRFHLRDLDDFFGIDWEAISATLEEPKFACLRRVAVYLRLTRSDCRAMAEAEELIKRVLPACEGNCVINLA